MLLKKSGSLPKARHHHLQHISDTCEIYTVSYKACELNLVAMESKFLGVISAVFWRPAPQQQKSSKYNKKTKHYAISNVGFTLKPHMQFLHSAYSDISIELHSAKPCNLSALWKKLRNQTAQEQIA